MPTSRADGAVIARPQLVERLAPQRVVVIAAPTGHGASTLIAQLAAARPGPTALVRCTDADQFGGLAGRVLDALAAAFPVLGEGEPVADTTGTARLAYALDALAGPATIALDDLHLAERGAANDLVQTIAEHAADDVAVIVATHGDLPPALARIVAMRGGDIVEARDLVFSGPECQALADRVGTTISPDELLARTGGWPLAVTALARGGEQLTPALGAELLAALSPAAQAELSALALVDSVPTAVVDDGPVGDELRRFAARHPGAFDLDSHRLALRALLRAALSGEPDAGVADDLADRLERHGELATALVMLSRTTGARSALQDRLRTVGLRLLDRGRFRLLHEVIGRIPARDRRADVLVLDAAARLGLQQLERINDDLAISDESLLALEDRDDLDDLDDDLRLAIAGLRTDVLRRNGDAALVGVALHGLAGVGSVDAGVAVADLVSGRSALARRGLHLLLYSLGAAALFSGDAALIAEGRRLQELSLAVAERCNIDTVALRGQMTYEHVTLGLVRPSAAVGALDASVGALQARGHPEAANHLAQLADVHIRLDDPRSAGAAIEAGRDWAERTGNVLVQSSLGLVAAATELLRDGPTDTVNERLTRAWDTFTASPRLRRIAPGAAARFANVLLDFADTAAAQIWIDRGRGALAERLQGGYQSAVLDATQLRLDVMARPTLSPAARIDDRFAAQPAGAAEHAATVAWDRLRRGDTSLVAEVRDRHGAVLDPPWPRRLGFDDADAPQATGPEVVIEVLRPEVRLVRNGRAVSPPSGHAARLLVRLVSRDGVLAADAAIDDLWPDAPPSAARNRLHQVLHRTRRALGGDADGMLTLTDGVLRLDSSRCGSDVGELKALGSLTLDDPLGRARACALLDGVTSSLCAAQFAYDEALDDDRWDLDRRVVELAVALLDTAPDDAETRRVVWGLWDRFPEQFALGEALEHSARTAGLDHEATRAQRRGLAG